MITHSGSCHCGRVRFEVDAPAELVIDECNCSMCSRTAYLHLIVTAERFRIVQGRDALTTYTFNRHIIKHRFCKHCGVLPFGEGTDGKGVATAAINIRCLNDFDFTKVPVHEYDGRKA